MDPERNLVWISLMLLAVFISMSPLFFFGIPSGHDSHQHFQFAQIYYDSLISGRLVPTWSAFENYGFGGIGTRFYPPLGYYTLAIARIITGNWFDATGVTFSFWMIVGCLGVYFWSREFFSKAESSLAGIFYALSPFHLAQIYQFFTYGEFVASSIIPFSFLFATRFCRQKKLADLLLLSCSYALLILSHIPSALIVSITLAIYSAMILDWKQWVKSISGLGTAFLVGAAASSFHWIKVVTEMNWLNHTTPTFSTGLYDYKNYFFPYSISFTGNFWATYLWLLFVVTILASLSLLLPAIFSLIKRTQTTAIKDFRGAMITGAFALFMSTPLSLFIWEAIPVLQRIQFAWRWFSVVTIVGVIAFAGLVYPLIKSFKSNRILTYSVLFFFSGLLAFNYLQIIIPSAQQSRVMFEEKMSNLINEKSFDCWWTIWAKEEAFDNQEKVSALSRKVTVTNWEREQRNFEVTVGEVQDLRVATFYYPYWQAKINGENVQTKLNDDGTILIPIPKETCKVSLFFDEPFFVKITKVISLLSWCFLALFGINSLIKKFKNKPKLPLTKI